MLRIPLSIGEIARKLRCNRGTALKYLKELKAKKQVLETCISTNLNVWKLTGKRLSHVAQNSGNNEWYTPETYIRAAVGVLGEIDLDPASAIPANKVVGAKVFYSAEDNGLTKDWKGKVWMNPPYATELIVPFCEKLLQHFSKKEVSEAIVLVNNATETSWFNKLIRCASGIMFPKSRIKFWSPDGRVSQPLQGQAVVYFGKNVESFVKHFKQFGWCARL